MPDALEIRSNAWTDIPTLAGAPQDLFWWKFSQLIIGGKVKPFLFDKYIVFKMGGSKHRGRWVTWWTYRKSNRNVALIEWWYTTFHVEKEHLRESSDYFVVEFGKVVVIHVCVVHILTCSDQCTCACLVNACVNIATVHKTLSSY